MSLTREQLVKHIKNLEKKIRYYQECLKQRDQEIDFLRHKLFELTGNASISFKTEPQNENKNSQQAAASSEQDVNISIRPVNEITKSIEKQEAPVPKNPSTQQEPIERESVSKMDFSPSEEDTAKEKKPFSSSSWSNLEGSQGINLAPLSAPGKFLETVLDGEEEADELKSLLIQLSQAATSEKRTILLSLTRVGWRLFKSMAKRLSHENLPWEKRLFMRYGMLDDKLMEQRMDVWNQLAQDRSKHENSGVYFLDEWLDEVARGNVKYSTIDEMALNGVKPDPYASGAKALEYEIINVEQMQRMSVGPRANMVTILLQEYCSPSRDNPIVNRKWLVPVMQEILECDYTLFNRRYKGQDIVVKPIFIICPGYGFRSGCWEPWSPGKKAQTGPRICLCAFPPKNSMKTLLMGLAEYRWEYAKADAMHYWLSEGLTGKWLALFNRKEQRLNLKDIFLDSYFHWMVNESNRIPKLEKRFREFFWTNVPFGDTVKQRLKGGGLFARLIELEEAKKKREEEEQKEIERIQAERAARKAARNAQR